MFLFGCTCFQTMEPDKEVNVLMTPISSGKYPSEGLYENQLPSFLIIFFMMCLGFISQSTNFELFFIFSFTCATAKKCSLTYTVCNF